MNRGSVILEPCTANCTSSPREIVEGILLWSTWRRLRMKRHVRIDEMLGNVQLGLANTNLDGEDLWLTGRGRL